MEYMNFVKVRDVKSPSRGTAKSAGIDFYAPNDMSEIKIGPGKDVLIPSGIRVRIPEGFALVALNKSGVATKKKLVAGACLIDEDYTGEMHLHLINTSDKEVNIAPGEKILQFVLIPINYIRMEEVSQEVYDSFGETERGAGGFGSTTTV